MNDSNNGHFEASMDKVVKLQVWVYGGGVAERGNEGALKPSYSGTKSLFARVKKNQGPAHVRGPE